MRKILIPTDFSDNAKNAIEYALELFKYEVSKFYILHAYQDEIYADNTLLTRETLDEVTSIVKEKSNKALQDILSYINVISPNPRHTYTILSANNILLEEVDSLVDSKNIDVIVMGTRGQTNDRKLSFGSHTLQILKYVQCPVLAIPENYKYKKPKHVLFPTNFMIPYKRRELKLLCEMTSPYRANIDVVYISKQENLSIRQEDNKLFIKEELCKNTVNFKTIKSNNIKKTIYNYIEENEINMLVMVNTRHSFLENILFQSTIDKISLEIKIPFLALQNINRC